MQTRALGAGAIAVVICFAIVTIMVGIITYYLLNIDDKKRDVKIESIQETDQTVYVAPDGSSTVINNEDKSIKTESGPTIGYDISGVAIPIAIVIGVGIFGYVIYQESQKQGGISLWPKKTTTTTPR